MIRLFAKWIFLSLLNHKNHLIMVNFCLGLEIGKPYLLIRHNLLVPRPLAVIIKGLVVTILSFIILPTQAASIQCAFGKFNLIRDHDFFDFCDYG